MTIKNYSLNNYNLKHTDTHARTHEHTHTLLKYAAKVSNNNIDTIISNVTLLQ